MFHQNDEEVFESLLFDIRYQYALGTSSYDEQPISKNILSNFRQAVYKYEVEHKVDLIKQEVEGLAKHFKKVLGIDDETKRMDSLMISSSCRKLSRLELIFVVVQRCVKAIDKINADLIPEELKVYLEEDYRNKIIYRSRDVDLKKRLSDVTADAVMLCYLDIPDTVKEIKEYQIMLRMLNEQTRNENQQMDIVPSKEISSESLQNPTDPDATYRRKGEKGYIGYVGNVVEGFDDNNKIIESYDLQKNTHSDHAFGSEVIEQMDTEGNTILIVDGAYYSDDNAEEAKEKNIALVPTDIVGKKPEDGILGYDKFVIDEKNHTVKSCPAGRTPVQESGYIYNNNLQCHVYRAYFDQSKCEKCLLNATCPIEKMKNRNKLEVSEKTLHRHQMISIMGTEEYIVVARKRAGVEGAPSVLRRKHNIDHLPVRGLVRVKTWFGLSIGALNCRSLIRGVVNKVMVKTKKLSIGDLLKSSINGVNLPFCK